MVEKPKHRLSDAVQKVQTNILSEGAQKAKLNEEWLKYHAKISEGKRYNKLSSGSVEDPKKICEEVAKICWERAHQDHEKIKHLSEELEKAKHRLETANLGAIKQVSLLKQQIHDLQKKERLEEIDLDDIVEFYEPMQHLDDTQRELVMTITIDKVRQMLEGDAPPSFLAAVSAAATAAPPAGDAEPSEGWKELLDEANERARLAEEAAGNMTKRLIESDEKIAELDKSLKAKTHELSVVQADLKAAQDREYLLQGRIKQLEDQVVHLEGEKKRLEEEKQQLEEELAAIKIKIAQFEQEIEALKAEIADLQEKLRKAEEELEEWKRKAEELQLKVEQLEEEMKGMKDELEATKTALAEAMEAIAGLEARALAAEAAAAEAQSKVEELEKRCEELESLMAAAVARAEEAEAERDELKAELARRNNTKTQSTQTTLMGEQIDELKDENKRQKTMLEELQMKIKELVEELGKKGLDVQDICEKVGLQPVLKAKSAFQRLYDDAMDRVERMEKLREKYAKEQRRDQIKFVSRGDLEAALENSTLEQEVRLEEVRQISGPSRHVVHQRPLRLGSQESVQRNAGIATPLRRQRASGDPEQRHVAVDPAQTPSGPWPVGADPKPLLFEPKEFSWVSGTNGGELVGAPGPANTNLRMLLPAEESSMKQEPRPRRRPYPGLVDSGVGPNITSAIPSIETRALVSSRSGASPCPDYLLDPLSLGPKERGLPLEFQPSPWSTDADPAAGIIADALGKENGAVGQVLASSASVPNMRPLEGSSLTINERKLKRAEDRRPRQMP